MSSPVAAVAASDVSADAERRVFAKIARRLMPVLIVSYILNYLDRTNVSVEDTSSMSSMDR